ncbi:MAG: hypothetical protein WC505_06970 [Patescibacteria group bacterium]
MLLLIQQDTPVTVSAGARGFVPSLVASSRPPSKADIVKSIEALKAKGVPVSPEKVSKYADAILTASRQHSIDPYLLVAIARVESNFTAAVRKDIRCSLPRQGFCSQDCGVTQQNFSGAPKWVKFRCAQVQKDYKESFMLAAEELAKHTEWCREKIHLDRVPERCILNRYNGGPMYRKEEQCKRLYSQCSALPEDRKQKCLFGRRRCMIIATYWTRVLCFHQAARTATTPTRDCRWCWSVDSIDKHFE